MKTTKTVYILEGPDGAGKSTTAKKLAQITDARYVHFSAMPRVNHGLARMYVEAMLPALLGYQNVVMDRCWLSEAPYGTVYRSGANRLHPCDIRMLERLAMRCGAVLIMCDPGVEICVENFTKRRAKEMLDDENQLRAVYDLYSRVDSSLPTVTYDFSTVAFSELWRVLNAGTELRLMPNHAVDVRSAGNLDAKVVIVGDEFAHHKENDPLYQWPFASFSDAGCSRWLTQQLSGAGIDEDQLCWVNIDQDLTFLDDGRYKRVIAVGRNAGDRLTELGIRSEVAPHPQAWKRFNFDKPYKLIKLLTQEFKQ